MTTIITRNSVTPSAVPQTGELTVGELAVNPVDQKLYSSTDGVDVVEVGTGGVEGTSKWDASGDDIVNNNTGGVLIKNGNGEIGEAATLSWGVIQSNGTPQGGTGDFSCVRDALGKYTITFDKPATATDSQCLSANVFSTNLTLSVGQETPTDIVVWLFNAHNDALEDATFQFIRVYK